MADEYLSTDPNAGAPATAGPEQPTYLSTDPGAGVIDQGDPTLAGIRTSYVNELNDPNVLGRLYSLTHREVGGQGPDAQQAFIETVFNRAAARNTTLAQTVSDPNYYPGVSLRPAALSQDDAARYGQMAVNAVQGSNVSNYATGNASGTVGFAGGPQTFKAGGERFGIEGPDLKRGWVPTARAADVQEVRVERAIPVTPVEMQVSRAIPVDQSATHPPLGGYISTDPDAGLIDQGAPGLGYAPGPYPQAVPVTPIGVTQPDATTGLEGYPAEQAPPDWQGNPPSPPPTFEDKVAQFLFGITPAQRAAAAKQSKQQLAQQAQAEPLVAPWAQPYIDPVVEKAGAVFDASRQYAGEAAKVGMSYMPPVLAARTLLPPDNPLRQAAEGLTDASKQFTLTMTEPDNLALMAATGGTGAGAKIMAGMFGAQMASTLPDQWQAFKDAPTVKEKVAIAAQAVATLGFIATSGAHAVAEGPIPGEAPGRPSGAKEVPGAAIGQPTEPPPTAEAMTPTGPGGVTGFEDIKVPGVERAAPAAAGAEAAPVEAAAPPVTPEAAPPEQAGYISTDPMAGIAPEAAAAQAAPVEPGGYISTDPMAGIAPEAAAPAEQPASAAAQWEAMPPETRFAAFARVDPQQARLSPENFQAMATSNWDELSPRQQADAGATLATLPENWAPPAAAPAAAGSEAGQPTAAAPGDLVAFKMPAIVKGEAGTMRAAGVIQRALPNGKLEVRLQQGGYHQIDPAEIISRKPGAAPATAPAPTLPADLRGAKPRYNYGSKSFGLDFKSDLDKASYIAAQATRSKADARYVKFVADATGLNEGEIRARGREIRATIKDQARTSTDPVLTVPTTEAHAAAEHQAEMLRQGQQAIEAQGGMELLKAVEHEGGLPPMGTEAAHPYRGELKMLRETVAGTKGVRYRDIFNSKSRGVDDLVLKLQARGFDIQTPHQLIAAIEHRIRTGTPHYGLPEFGASVNYARSVDPATGKRYSLPDETRAAFKGTGESTPELRALARDISGTERGAAPNEGGEPFLIRVEPKGVSYNTPAGRQIARAELLAKAFRREITWFRPDRPIGRNGASKGRSIFLNVDATEDPVHVVAAHELTHDLQQNAPGLYRELSKALSGPRIKEKPLEAYAEERVARGYTPAQFPSELVADFVAETLRDPTRFDQALGNNPGLGRRVLTHIRDFIDKTLRKLGLRKTPDASSVVTDLTATRQTVMKTLEAYRTGAQGPPAAGPAQFARAPAPEGAFSLAPPETLAEQKAREVSEQAAAQARATEAEKKAQVKYGWTQKITGTAGDLGQRALFDQPEDLFAGPAQAPRAEGEPPTPIPPPPPEQTGFKFARQPPSQEELEAAAASGDREKMRGHIATIKRMLEVSPDVRARVESLYTPSTTDAVNRAANQRINNIGLGKATDEFMRSRTTDAGTMAMGHNLALRLDEQQRYEEAAMVRDKMAEKLTTPAQALQYISTIGKTSPEGLIRTAQALMTDMIKPEDRPLLDQINRLRAEIASLKDEKAKAAATQIVIKQMAKVNKPGQRLTQAQLDNLLTKHARGELNEDQLAQTLTKYFKIPRLTPENIGKIKAAQKAWADVPDDNPILKSVRAADMMDSVYGLVPRTFWDKVRAASVISMITHGKLPVRIGASSALRLAGQTVVDGIQNILPDLGNIFSGRRTLTGGQVRGIIEGLYDPIRAYRAGYTDAKVRGLATVPSFKEGMHSLLTRANLVNRGLYDVTQMKGGALHTFSSRFGRLAENTMALLHNVMPLGFYDAAYRSSLYRQMRAARVEVPDADMVFNAHLDANKVISNNPTMLYAFAREIRKGLDMPTAAITKGKYGLGTALLPFALKPASLLTEGATWTPLGLGKATAELLRPVFNKGEPIRPKEVGDALVKAALGTGVLVGAGYQLAKIGVLTGAPDDNKDLEAMRKASGWGAYKINVSELKRRAMSWDWHTRSNTPADGDYIVNYNWLEPAAFPIAAGADLAQSQEKRLIDLKRGKITTGAALSAAGAGLQSLTDAPMLQGVQQFAQAVGEGQWGRAFVGLFANVPGNFVPAIARQISQYIDNTVRETRGTIPTGAGTTVDREASNIMAQIPGLEQRYPPKYDVFGDAVQRYNYGNNSLLNVFLNPAMISKFKSNPQLAEMQHLYEATGATKGEPRQVPATLMVNGKQVELTNEQVSAYQRYVGKESSAVVTRLLASPQFAAEPIGVKQAVISQVLSAVNTAAKIDLFGQSPVQVGMGAKGPTISKPSPLDIGALLEARQQGFNRPPGAQPAGINRPAWQLAPSPALPSLAP